MPLLLKRLGGWTLAIALVIGGILVLPIHSQNAVTLFGVAAGVPVPIQVDTSGNLKISNLAGTGVTSFKPQGVLFAPIVTDIPATADTNFVCVALGTIKANTITKNGDEVIIEFDQIDNATGGNITFIGNVGGTCAANSTGFTGGFNFYVPGITFLASNFEYFHTVHLIRTSAGNFKGNGTYTGVNTSATQGSTTITGTATETGDLSLGLAFKGAIASSTILKFAHVIFRPAP